MCGIVGYVGKKNAVRTVLEGIKRLEYRGYDSAGIASVDYWGNVFLKKSTGRINSLEKKIKKDFYFGASAVAHTRWATHGEPNLKNAHPHSCCQKEVFVVHNGIIENHESIRDALEREGHKFVSETDSEVAAHLIERQINFGAKKLEDAVAQAVRHLVGTFGLAVIHTKEPNKVVGVRRGSPLLVGLGSGENILASDASAVVGRTKRVIYLNDNELAVLTPKSKKVFKLKKTGITNGKPLRKPVSLINWSVEDSQKSGFSHFMGKEIFEIPKVIENALRGRVVARKGEVKLGGLDVMRNKLQNINRVIITAMGTSYNAGLAGKYLFESFAGLPAEVYYSSEFRYHPPIVDKNTLVLAISQSGETSDTLGAVREAKTLNATTLAIVNVVGSSIAREVDAGIYNHAGPEIAVASTKAFISQLSILALLSVYFGRMNKLEASKARSILSELLSMPDKSKKILENNSDIRRISGFYKGYKNFMYLGRKFNWAPALEGALKLKEISYLHAEGYSAGEMKHGPIALIDNLFPSVVLCPKDSVYDKTLSNIQEIKARRGKVIAIATENDINISKYTTHIIRIPEVSEELSPIMATIPLYLFAYYVAVFRGCDVDKPRNLAKSVTVE